jgi:hypothetical protein
MAQAQSAEHFDFALRQTFRSYMFRYVRGNLGAYSSLATMHGVNGVDKLGPEAAFEKIPHGTSPQGARRLDVAGICRERDYASLAVVAPYFLDNFDPTPIRQLEVHYCDIGPECIELRHRIAGPICGGHELQPILPLKHESDPVPNNWMVVHA